MVSFTSIDYDRYKEVITRTILKYTSGYYKDIINDIVHDVMILIDPQKLTNDDIINNRIISSFTKKYIQNNYYKYIDTNVVYIPTFDIDFDEESFDENIPQYQLLKSLYKSICINDMDYTSNNDKEEFEVDNSKYQLIEKILNFQPTQYVSPKILNIFKQLYIIYILNLEELKQIKIKEIKYPKNMFILDLFIQLYTDGKLELLYNSIDNNYKIVKYEDIKKVLEQEIRIYNEASNNKRKTPWSGNTYRALTYLSNLID